MASQAFDQAFTGHAMASYAKQLALADAIEGLGDWDLDLQAGTLTFGANPPLKIGLLGSFGEGAGSWLWAWANKNMAHLPTHVTAVGERMRRFGSAKQIAEFQDAETPATDLFCHRIAMIAAGEEDASAYYRAPYEGGAAFLLIEDTISPPPERHHLARVQRVIAESISTFEMPHRDAIGAYFATEGLGIQESAESEVLASAEDGDLRIRFDEQGRITEMKALLRAATKPSGGFFNRLFRKGRNDG